LFSDLAGPIDHHSHFKEPVSHDHVHVFLGGELAMDRTLSEETLPEVPEAFTGPLREDIVFGERERGLG
jgi:hypothetical protein